MNAIEKLSGAESAARILGTRRWETMECGHGHCAASVPCTGACKLKDAIVGLPVLDTMTDDRFNLHRVDTSQLAGKRDSMSFGGLDHLPRETSEHIASVARQGHALKTVFWVCVVLAGGFLFLSYLP